MHEAAKEYGTALFALACEQHLEQELLEQSRELLALLEKHPAYVCLLSDPSVAKQQRVAQAKEAFEGRVHPFLMNFVCVLIEAGRAQALLDCIKVYERLYCEANGIGYARVYSAVALSEAQQRALCATLAAKTGKKVELTLHVDPSLIGGVRVSMDGVLYDNTVRFKLDQLRDTLSAVTL